MNSRHVTIADLYGIIGSQTVEIEFLKSQTQQLQTMLEQMKKTAEEAKNGVTLNEQREIIG